MLVARGIGLEGEGNCEKDTLCASVFDPALALCRWLLRLEGFYKARNTKRDVSIKEVIFKSDFRSVFLTSNRHQCFLTIKVLFQQC